MSRKNSTSFSIGTSTRALAAMIALSALGLSFASSASALGNLALSAAPSVDSSSNAYYLDNTTVTASATGLTPSSSYYVGVCETATYPLGIPACASFVSTSSDSLGAVSTTILIKASAVNNHAALPFQPSTIDCSAVDACQVVVADHTGRVFVESSVPFYVN